MNVRLRERGPEGGKSGVRLKLNESPTPGETEEDTLLLDVSSQGQTIGAGQRRSSRRGCMHRDAEKTLEAETWLLGLH